MQSYLTAKLTEGGLSIDNQCCNDIEKNGKNNEMGELIK